MISASACFDQCHILDTGWCEAREAIMVRGTSWKRVRCHCVAALLHHPEHGWMLWDTGYAPQMLDATRRFPMRLYRAVTPLHLDARLSVVAQLPKFGLAASDVRTVVLSHLHADHVAGARDFPDARFVVSRAAWENVRALPPLKALGRGYLPPLLPPDFESRTRFLDEFTGPDVAELGATLDLWNDGSALLVRLPGHARGQIGMLAQLPNERVFFVADGCWHRASLRTGRAPHPLTHRFVDNPKEVQTTVDRLGAFSRAHPEVAMVPTHCPEAFAERVEGRR